MNIYIHHICFSVFVLTQLGFKKVVPTLNKKVLVAKLSVSYVLDDIQGVYV